MKKLNSLTLEQYLALENLGLLFEFYPDATGDENVDLYYDRKKDEEYRISKLKDYSRKMKISGSGEPLFNKEDIKMK